jgi:MSHA pilin protein MshC
VRVNALKSQRGFTLIELVMVIVLLGVLAVFVAPKFVGTSAFNVRGFHDENLAYLRYAQKTAVAQRRTVCVAFTTGAVSLSMASVAQSYTCDTTLSGPRGERPATASAKVGVFYDTTLAPSDFRFDSLGQPVDASGAARAKQTFKVADASASITVETSTGYVHE